MADAPTTRVTLLARLATTPADPLAWGEFVARYGPAVRDWFRRWGLQDADADDVTQALFVRLTAKLPAFRYDGGGTFRGWLKTLAHHAWYDELHRRVPPARGTGDPAVHDALAALPARDDLAAR